MDTIALLSQKGGSGKTTLAVHLAGYGKMQGKRVALIDLDPQGSASSWNVSRGDKLDGVQGEAGKLPELLSQAEGAGVALSIVDTAPHSNRDAALVAHSAGLVLMPCRPARFDLEAIMVSVEIARLAGVKGVVVLTMAPRGKLVEEARSVLEGQGVQVCKTIVMQRVAYSHAVIDGSCVHEYEPEGKAAREIAALYNELFCKHVIQRRNGYAR
jgi:chromosome partitioning protein